MAEVSTVAAIDGYASSIGLNDGCVNGGSIDEAIVNSTTECALSNYRDGRNPDRKRAPLVQKIVALNGGHCHSSTGPDQQP
jgi:hypothetical protein